MEEYIKHKHIGVYGLIIKENKILLIKKKTGPYDGKLDLPGGSFEFGERPEETLKREFIEEAGLTITDIKEFITIDCYWITRNNDDMNSLANFYIVEICEHIIDATEKESKLVILEKTEIKDKLPLPYQKEAINLFLNHINN